MKHLEPYLEQLKKAGYKLTHQRLVILDYLLKSRDHPSADMIYEDLRRHYPTISLATVYNTLEVFSRIGLVVDVGAPGERRRFDGITSPHSHHFCQQCGRIEDAEFSGQDPAASPAAAPLPLHATRCRLDYFGLCAQCRAASAASTLTQTSHQS